MRLTSYVQPMTATSRVVGKTVCGVLTIVRCSSMLASILCMATAIYYESRSESLLGQVAVATIIMNRVNSPAYPETVCEVFHQGGTGIAECQFSAFCDGKHERPTDTDAWTLALHIAISVVAEDARVVDLEDSLWYYGKHLNLVWSARMRRIEIGNHAFFIDDFA